MSIVRRIKNLIEILIPKEYLWMFADRMMPKTFGQLGEDAVIENHLGWLGLPVKQQGIYLDIGAYHPTRGSNTWRFYRRGSRGYAIDIGARKRKIWSRVRPRDIFIEGAVVPDSYKESFVEFTQSDNYGTATDHVIGFGVIDSVNKNIRGGVEAVTASAIKTKVLSDPAWMHAPWRFISIDIEGLDHQFLSDLDLVELAPDVVAVEHFLPEGVSDWEKDTFFANSCLLVSDMRRRKFSLQSICGPTLIFVRIDSRK